MAKREYNGECLVRCNNCKSVNTAVWKGFFGLKHWSIKNCTKCNEKINLKNIETVLCPHCGKLVEKAPDNCCLNCGKLIYHEDEMFSAECPNCGVINMIPLKHEEDVFCNVCGEQFPGNLLKSQVKATRLEAQNIRLKDQHAMLNEDLVIWKHPLNQFSAKSRLQVSEGTWALLLKDGVCQYPYGPGSYLLEDTDLGQKAKLEAAAAGEDVVLNTDIFCVIKKLPEIKWGTSSSNKVIIQDSHATRDYQIIANGSILWNVVDAKAFAERFGFRELHGKQELTLINTDPGTTDADLVRETRKAIHDAMVTGAGNLIGMDDLDPLKLGYKQAELEKQLINELDRIMDGIGLGCESLRISFFKVEEILDSSVTVETKRRDTIRGAAQKMIHWSAENIRLYPGANRDAYADYSFEGTARLSVTDEKKFFEMPEIQSLPNDSKAAENFFSKALGDSVRTAIAPAAQSLINENRIPILDLYLHTSLLADSLKSRVQERFSLDGAELDYIRLDPPTCRESDSLKRAYEMEERKKKLIRYAEKPIQWETDPLSVHMKDQPGLKADVIFSGDCSLKITDESQFFERSEIQEFLNSTPFADEKAVNHYYADRIKSHFSAKLAGITQSMIDSHSDWDVRELQRYTEQLKAPAIDTLNTLISDWGMRVESAYLKTKVIQSEALQQLGDLEKLQTVSKIKVDTHRTDNQTNLAMETSDAETAMKRDDLQTEIYQHSAENKVTRIGTDGKVKDALTDLAVDDISREDRIKAAKHASELKGIQYKTETEVTEIQGSAAVDEAADQRKADQTQRGYEAENRKQQHEQELTRAAQDAKFRLEETEEEHKRTLEEIRHETGLDDARFRETLNGILRRIDESDLEWRKKLEEYARLSRQLGVQDAQDARRAVAETDAEIKRMTGKADADVSSMKTAANFEAGIKGVELNSAQAELQEKINRYAEDRDERKLAADFNRRERMAVLTFEQNLEDRRQKAEETLAQLKEQHAEAQREREYQAQIAEMKAQIEKLKVEMETERIKIREEAGLGKAQSANDARAKEAEYKYLAEKESERKQREDSMMDRAESLFRYVQSIQTAMERARMDLQKHADDNETSVRRDYADVEKIRAAGLNQQQREEIMRKLDELEREITRKDGKGGRDRYSDEEYSKLLKKIRELMDAIHKDHDSIEEIRKTIKTIANSRTCWKCGANVAKNTRYCSSCGASLVPGQRQPKGKNQDQPGTGIVCTVCGTTNAPGETKCRGCGSDLA